MQIVENVLLMGGGFDSTTLFLAMHYNRIPFSALHVDYGQQAYEAEKRVITQLCLNYSVPLIRRTETMDIKQCNAQPNIIMGTSESDPYLIGRNYYLLSYAAAHGENVWIGLSEGRIFDCTLGFIYSLNALWSHAFDAKRRAIAPFVDDKKLTLINLGKMLDEDYHDYISSCYHPNYEDTRPATEIHEKYGCGRCSHCKERTAYQYNTDYQTLSPELYDQLLEKVKA